MNEQLLGIVIDPGHGGSDSGAIGSDMYEKDYNLLISKYMYDRLKELNVPVSITRSSDTTLSPKERTDEILSFYGNNPNVIVISNHLNAGGGEGAEVIYALRNPSTLATSVLNNLEAAGATPRRIYQRTLPSDPTKDYYFIHRNTGQTEPLIVEYGFIDNDKNLDFLKANYENLAEAIIKAILSYKNLPYTPPNQINIDIYKVAKGDTLYKIASKLGTTVDTLKALNNLQSNNITEGQILKIPANTVSPEQTEIYTVASGDTLYSIARKLNTTISKIKELNNLTSDNLSVGMTLRIPSNLTNYQKYTIEKGDSLYSISKKFNTTAPAIKKLNNITSNILSIGTTILIPSPNQKNNTYTVERGDTLYSIAKRLGVSVDSLKAANNLTTNMLSVGDKLIIPTEEKTTHKVTKGDTLYSLARKYNTTVANLKTLNNLPSDTLTEGQILILN